MQLILRWIISAAALYITVLVGQALGIQRFHVASGRTGIEGLFLFVVILAVINAVLRPLVELLTLPISCLTFGLFALLVNALMFWLAGQFTAGFGFHVSGWQAPLFGSIVMSIVGGGLSHLLVSNRERRRNRR